MEMWEIMISVAIVAMFAILIVGVISTILVLVLPKRILNICISFPKHKKNVDKEKASVA